MNFKAAIFDLDGTLIDSMSIWGKIALNFLEKLGFTIPEDYLSTICPMKFIDAAEYTISRFGLNISPSEVIDEWNRMAGFEYENNIKLKPFVYEYLLLLRNKRIKLAVATASPLMLCESVLKLNKVYGFFDAFASTDEVPRGKDHPDVYLLAAERLQVKPSDCAVFEDISAGIKSAKLAGMKAYGISDACSAHEWSEIKIIADGYFESFSQLLTIHK